MIVVYTSPGCASCRKVKQWLKDRDLPFIEKNIFKTLLNTNEIKHLLMRSENGSDDIISKRSKIIQESSIDIDAMSQCALLDVFKMRGGAAEAAHAGIHEDLDGVGVFLDNLHNAHILGNRHVPSSCSWYFDLIGIV